MSEPAGSGAPNGVKGGVLLTLGVVTLAVAFADGYLLYANQDLQARLDQQQRALQEGIRISNANVELIRLLAAVTVRTEDADLAKLLADHGISLSVTPAPMEPARDTD